MRWDGASSRDCRLSADFHGANPLQRCGVQAVDDHSSSNTLVRCRYCGFQWLLPESHSLVSVIDGRVVRCAQCPAREARNDEGNASCSSCGSTVRTEWPGSLVVRCEACIRTDGPSARCCYRFHRGNRVTRRADVKAYLELTPTKREERTVYACQQCAHRHRLVPWEQRELKLFMEGVDVPVRPDFDATPTANDPYASCGGREALWKPRAGIAGVGSYILFLYQNDRKVYLKGKTYRARCGTCEGRPVFTFAVLPVDCRKGDWVFLAVTGVESNTYRHVLTLFYGDRDSVMERALALVDYQGRAIVGSNQERKLT